MPDLRKNLIKNMAVCLLLPFSAALFFGCGDKKDEQGDAAAALNVRQAELDRYPAEVRGRLDTMAAEYFGENKVAAAEWKNRQLSAYSAINSIVPEIPLEKFGVIRKNAEEKSPHNYIEQQKFITAQTDAYAAIESRRYSKSKSEFDFALGEVEKLYPDDFKLQEISLDKWASAYRIFENVRTRISPEVFDAIIAEGVERARGNPVAFEYYLRDQLAYKNRVDGFRERKISAAVLDELKLTVSEIYPADYKTQFDELTVLVKDRLGEQNAKPESKDSLAEKAKKVFRESVFTMRGPEEDIYCAALVKIKGKTAILCAKEFIPNKLPAVFGNSRGKIKCSKAYVSKEYPIVLMFPDEEPTQFEPMEIISAEESADISEKPLYMIAPDKGGFRGVPVSVFSEDLEYLNLSSETSPATSRKVNLSVKGRNADKIFVSIVDKMDIGENSVVIDPESGKLVSVALRVYNPGMLNYDGKTGSVIGHERAVFPDFNTLVRSFDGATQRTVVAPRSSLRFVRMTAFDDWAELNPEELNSQKTKIRKFTDDNNDFLMFFKANTFDNALRSRRLGTIAERFRRPLLLDSLTRASYERTYKNYMMEVLYALKREIIQYPNTNGFYSVYKNELQYQINLRAAMHEYLAELVRDDTLINSIHADLKNRYDGIGNTFRTSKPVNDY